MITKRPQINSVKKICGTERKQKKLFDEPALAGEEFFFCSGVKKIFRNLFAVLNFCFFSFKRKEVNGFVTMINVIPSGNYLVIEAWNKHCSIRVAEKNTRVLYRLIKTSFRLYLKTIKILIERPQKKK